MDCDLAAELQQVILFSVCVVKQMSGRKAMATAATGSNEGSVPLHPCRGAHASAVACQNVQQTGEPRRPTAVKSVERITVPARRTAIQEYTRVMSQPANCAHVTQRMRVCFKVSAVRKRCTGTQKTNPVGDA